MARSTIIKSPVMKQPRTPHVRRNAPLEPFKRQIYRFDDFRADHRGAGIAFDSSGEWENALLAFDSAVQFSPRDAEAWMNLGVCKMRMAEKKGGFVAEALLQHAEGHLNHANKLGRQAGAQSPINNRQVENNMKHLQKIKSKVLGRSDRKASKGVYHFEDPKGDHINAAKNFDRKGDSMTALLAFESATRFTPGNAEGHKGLGEIKIKIARTHGRKSQASAFLQHARRHLAQAQRIAGQNARNKALHKAITSQLLQVDNTLKQHKLPPLIPAKKPPMGANSPGKAMPKPPPLAPKKPPPIKVPPPARKATPKHKPKPNPNKI